MFQARSLILGTLPRHLHGKETHPRFFSSLMALLSLLNLVLLASAQVRPLIVSPPEPPPWIFAAPTGATKVTVYWDPSPSSYTTGYVVLWGTRQGGPYPNSSPELPSTQRQYTVQGLQQEQTYSFVVKAVFRGTGVVYSDPSEEDDAIPNAKAIPWDTQDTQQILNAVREVTGYIPPGKLSVLGPDGLYYEEDEVGNPLPPASPPGVYKPDTFSFDFGGGLVVPRTITNEEEGLFQGEDAVGDRGGYAPSGSFILREGVGYDPVYINGAYIDPPAEGLRFSQNNWIWEQWTSAISAVRNFPNTSIVQVQEVERYFREVVSIDLR